MEDKSDIEKYRKENPMDYLKAIELIKNNPTNGEIMKAIYKIKEHNGRLIDDFSSFHRISCFTSNGINCMPMWAHYSNNHKGYCVEYSMEDKHNVLLRSCMFPVQYVDKRIDITEVMKKQVEDILSEKEKAIKLRKKEILINDLTLIWISSYYSCLKHISWSYENEFRCTVAANAKGIPYMNAMPKAIYIGNKCSEINKKYLVDIAYTLNVPIYFMGFDEYSSDYELIPKNIL